MFIKSIVAVLLVGGASVLSGCVSSERMAKNDDGYCRSIGARPGTDGYTQCRLSMTYEHEEDSRAYRGRVAAAGRAMIAANAYRPAPYVPVYRPIQSCTSQRIGTLVQTNCY